MNAWLFLFLWVGFQVLQLVFVTRALRRQHDTSGRKRIIALAVSGVASIVPFITLVLFLWVFVIGGSSNVAQLAGESGLDLWSLWFHVWPLLFAGNPPAFLAAVAAVLLPPYPPKYWESFVSRVCAVVAASCAWYAVVTFFPDA
jgi:hypothetical protein